MSRPLTLAALFGLMVACSACQGSEAAPQTSLAQHAERPAEPASKPAAEPFEHEADTEYQNGLASLMYAAPVLGSKLVTSAFRIGYLTGVQEARAYQYYTDGGTGAIGCSAGFVAIRDYFAPPTEADAARVKDLCDNKEPKAQLSGALFSQWRLKEAQWAGEHLEDPREIDILITIYTVGYNMGFAHQWETLDQETHVEKVVYERCEEVVEKIKPPLSAAQVAVASSKCRDEATDTRQKFGNRLKCLLTSPGEMNGDLSGEWSKAGCAH